ncbi:MAG TPA: malto-oligosyltrehalose synthase [Spirochaetota bacterium]|nr:malto-oligosyltrehalose synthase [Spirochaetota bacterium]
MRVPISTYRLQFNREFTFNDAGEILSYLSDLGITDIYSSPVFSAVTGSMHGYDVVDHNSLNIELGSEEEFYKLHEKRAMLDMGWLQDIVPNHMAFHGENRILTGLLEHGDNSEFRNFFDIEWEHAHESLRGRLLVPVLGRFYSEAIEQGEIKIEYNEEGLFAVYYEHKFPLSLVSYPVLFCGDETECVKGADSGDVSMIKLQGALHQFRVIAESPLTQSGYNLVAHAKKMLWELYNSNPQIRGSMNEQIALYNTPGPEDYAERLDEILELQNYRLSFWKVAAEEINYRRFFNINGLISLRVEDDEVFDYIHSYLKELTMKGLVTGIRVDHVDGLRDPARYMHRLRKLAEDAYIVVEKIINKDEILPAGWPIQGTTGYDFMNILNSIFCKTENEKAFSRIYSDFTKHEFIYEEFVAEKKRLIIDKHMTGDIDNLAVLLKQFSGNDRYGRDITLYGLRNALVELIAFFPVYRTYIDSESISEEDSSYIKKAFEKARLYTPEYSFEYDFLEKCLTLKYIERMDEEKTDMLLRFIMRFQQYTGPFMAKGFEDTVLYIVNRLISLNEVGGEPGEFGITLARFHNYILKRASSHPASMSSTSTHDTKRGEDVRCRINVLSEYPGEWKKMLSLWSKINNARKSKGLTGPIPDRNDEYFIYQTLIGTWPFNDGDYEEYVRRIRDYMIKAVREAKVHTAWIKPDSEYEVKLLKFIDSILLHEKKNRFHEKFLPFSRKIAFYGLLNSLSQVMVKITSPGVPDFYQGTELWELHLVDPDNRGRVNYTLRSEYLEYIAEKEITDIKGLISELWESRDDGRIKMFLIHRLLGLRKKAGRLFLEGDYIPLCSSGKGEDSVIAFMRLLGEEAALVIAPRFVTMIAEEGKLPAGSAWEDTAVEIPVGMNLVMEDVITGESYTLSGKVMVKDVITEFPGTVMYGAVNKG